jgi:predicted RNA polymerase sigma factor
MQILLLRQFIARLGPYCRHLNSAGWRLDVAEEAVQEAFTAAADQWRTSGVLIPRRDCDSSAQAIDRIRRRTRFEEKLNRSPLRDSDCGGSGL